MAGTVWEKKKNRLSSICYTLVEVVAFDIIAEDFKEVLDAMIRQDRISSYDANYLLVRMIKLAKNNRGYL